MKAATRACSARTFSECSNSMTRSLFVASDDPTVDPCFGRRGISDTLDASTRRRVIMKVVTLKDIPNVPVEGAERIEGWTGPVSRSRQTIIEPGDSANYNCSVV